MKQTPSAPGHLDPVGTAHPQRRAWPATAVGAGLCAIVATLLPSGRVSQALGYLAVALLLVAAAHWRRRVEPRVPRSTATQLVALGLVASAAGLACGYAGAFGDDGAAAGWLGVVVAAGAVAWMALRERTVSRWIGVVSLLPVVQTTLVVVGLGLPAAGALLGPVWLVVAGLGLALGRSTIMR
jgi:hypothetical protein